MYQEYFSLTALPFSIAPDPRYLYMSERHREALAHLLYGLDSDGAFILLTGEVGTGKTTVSRCLLEQIPENTQLALVLNPKVSAIELLQTICDELRIRYQESATSIKDYVDLINQFLLQGHAQNKKTVVLIEEAQNLDLEVLEQLRLLTNLETNERKLLQVILLGQPEFLEVLDLPELSQLAQRITARYHLEALNYNEMLSYISHRLAVAGCRQALFNPSVLKRLFQISQGVPRVINLICDRALLGCYVQNKPRIDRQTLDNAAKEVIGERSLNRQLKNKKAFNLKEYLWPVTALLLALVVLAGAVFYSENKIQTVSEVAQKIHPENIKNFQAGSIERFNVLAWPDSTERLRNNSLSYQAFQVLFNYWQLDYDPIKNGTPCFYAQNNNLPCLHGNGSLADVRGINRPAVLLLKGNNNQMQYAALTGLNQQQATIVLAGEQKIWSLGKLKEHWTGDYTLIWRRPPGYFKSIHPGHEGEEVTWLSEKINQIKPTEGARLMSIYQDGLIAKVRQFQREQGLVADGIVGVYTLIRINDLIGRDAPLLENNG